MADDAEFLALLHYLRDDRGFDFTGYKRNTLSRRIDKRMGDVGVSGYAEYIDHLQVHPDEFPELFNTILINVTSFFRDDEAWAHLGDVVLPRILSARSADEPVRVWSAGCASGEEAYSLAILLADQLGTEAFVHRVKIYATDVDEDALLTARNGVYDRKALEHVDEARVDQYFEPIGSQCRFRTDLRRNLIFGRHDITRDAPISHLDLLVCRNTLMYFNAEAQTRVLPRFHYALRPDGALFLGRAEMLLTHADLFRPSDMSHRIFERVGGREVRLPDLVSPPVRSATPPPDQSGERRLRDVAFDAGHVAELVIDLDSRVRSVNSLARAGFGIVQDDVGKPLHELEVSYRPIELRSRIEQAFTEHRPIQVRNVERTFPQGDPQFLDVVLSPLDGPDGSPIGMSVKFIDVTRFILLQMDLKRSNEELETAYEELQSTNEELETTNEELQSTVEELETTNEELQSTNEELETMNEELQSTNEELETMNVELRVRTDELDRSNRFHDSLLAALTDTVIAVDDHRRVVLWSQSAADLWGVDADEARGVPLDQLDFGLPVEDLRADVDRVLAGEAAEEVRVLDAVNRRGRSITVEVAVRPVHPDRPRAGVVLVASVEAAPAG